MGQGSSQIQLSAEKVERVIMAHGRVSQELEKQGEPRSEELEQPAYEEAESAQASVELYQPESRHTESMNLHTPQREYSPSEMTSQERINSEIKRRKDLRRRNRRRTKDEVVKELAGLDLEGTQHSILGHSSTTGGPADQTSTDQDLSRIHEVPHPLDDTSTESDVEEYERVTRAMGDISILMSPEGQEPNVSSPQSQETLEDPPPLPAYSASQRTRAIQEGMRKDRPRRRKQAKVAGRVNRKRPQQKFSVPVEARQPIRGDSIADEEEEIHRRLTSAESRSPDDAIPSNLNTHSSSLDKPEAKRSANSPLPAPWTPNVVSPLQPRTKPRTKPRKRKRKRSPQSDTPSKGILKDLMSYEKPYVSPYLELEKPGDVHLQDNDANDTLPHVRDTVEGADAYEASGSNTAKNVSEGMRPFGPAETEQIECFRKSWCEMNGKRFQDFNDIVQSNMRGNATAILLFKDIYKMFPYHKTAYIQRFCRRKFHNFDARGTWTPDEDKMLRQTVAETGTSWTTVGDIMHRFPEDCRDRWRNYLFKRKNRNQDKWNADEVLNLARAILHCAQDAKTTRQWQESQDGADDYLEDPYEVNPDDLSSELINWQAVSDRMGKEGGARSRLQCSMKWNSTKAEDRVFHLRRADEDRRKGIPLRDLSDDRQTKVPDGWRKNKAIKAVPNMLAGDKADLLHAILDTDAETEGNIFWKSVGSKDFQAKWPTTARKTAWLMMKASVQTPEGQDYRQTCYRLLQCISEAQTYEHLDPNVRDLTQPKRHKRSYVRRKPGNDERVSASIQNSLEHLDHCSIAPQDGHGDTETLSIEIMSDNDDAAFHASHTNSEETLGGLDPPLTPRPELGAQTATLNEGMPVCGMNGFHGAYHAHFATRIDEQIPLQLEHQILSLPSLS